MKEETDRTGSILKAGLHFGLDCGLRAICPVSVEMEYQLENQTPQKEEPQSSYLDSPSKNTLIICVTNRIINSIMLIGVWPQAYG